ncbi:MAG: hypothetical protein ACLQT7_08490 [Candidatus Dormibacteria bacterium]
MAPAPPEGAGRASRLVAVVMAVPLLLGSVVAAGCGGGPTSLSVALCSGSGPLPCPAGAVVSGAVAAGQTLDLEISVTDTGAAGTSGLTVVADLPADFRYSDTGALGGSAVRTSPVEAQGNSQDPTWGVWELSGHGDDVVIPFVALAGGDPGSYTISASASGSSTGSTQSNPFAVKLDAAPQLSASVSVTPGQAVAGQDVTYTVTVLNSGSGPAGQVSVLVTLPPVFAFDGGIQIQGNSGRSGGTDPVEGSELAFFNGFEIPAQSGGTPGQLKLQFNAQVIPGSGAEGTYPVGAQVLGDNGLERVDIAETAPVTVS